LFGCKFEHLTINGPVFVDELEHGASFLPPRGAESISTLGVEILDLGSSRF
jgi:hypothetical protein